MRVLLGNAWESRSPLPRLAGVSTVMRTLPPQPPEGHQRRRRGRHESAWRLHALREVNLLFQSPREMPLCFRTPRCINQKLITITDNETIGRVDRAIKRLRCDMRPNTIGNLVKSDLSDRNFVDCRILTTRLPEWANGLATAMTDAVM